MNNKNKFPNMNGLKVPEIPNPKSVYPKFKGLELPEVAHSYTYMIYDLTVMKIVDVAAFITLFNYDQIDYIHILEDRLIYAQYCPLVIKPRNIYSDEIVAFVDFTTEQQVEGIHQLNAFINTGVDSKNNELYNWIIKYVLSVAEAFGAKFVTISGNIEPDYRKMFSDEQFVDLNSYKDFEGNESEIVLLPQNVNWYNYYLGSLPQYPVILVKKIR